MNRVRVRLVGGDRVLRPWGWVVRGLLLAVLVPGGFLTGGLLHDVLGPSLISKVVVTGSVVAALMALAISDCRCARYWWVALSFGMYVGVLTYLAAPLAFHIHLTYHGHNVEPHAMGPVWALSFGLVYLCTWRIVQAVSGPILIQDGTLCPGCGYCLRGCTGQRCPECGREYSLEELGTANAELDARAEDAAEGSQAP